MTLHTLSLDELYGSLNVLSKGNSREQPCWKCDEDGGGKYIQDFDYVSLLRILRLLK